jgi:ubiquinone/menaquinone biosynthesis C-methylase UbiE
METNQAKFNNEEIIKRYKSELNLQPAEKTIVELIKTDLAESKVLDIGVGTGRTTAYIAPYCESYIGVDYAPNMVEYCKKKFNYSNASFEVADARSMEQFENEEFDIVIFSFNGIDCIPYEDRSKTLHEINRVLKPQGSFIFSTHNTRNIKKKFSFNYPRNPLNILKEKERLANFRKHNGSIEDFYDKEYFLLFDGAENDWTIQLTYIKPEFQNEILKEHGFSETRFFHRTTGKELTSDQFFNYLEPWLYYWCVKG